MSSSQEISPASTPTSQSGIGQTHAPKYGTVIPNRIFVGGIAAHTTDVELREYFSAYGAVKDSKIIADRAGVSKGYGFITFETQEDAENIIKKEADNLIFKDRKLNIGPAIRKQQAFPRYDTPTIPSGTVLFTNGVPYTYQNGMAIFQSQEGAYPMPQPQPQAAYHQMMMPAHQPLYAAVSSQPQYSYPTHTAPSWTAGQWRWTPQSPTPPAMTNSQAAASAAAYMSYAAMQPLAPEMVYAQPPPQAYQPQDLDAAMMEAAPAEYGAYGSSSFAQHPYNLPC